MGVGKGYKQTDVGVIPEDWDVSPLGKQLRKIPSYGINAPAIPFDFRFPTYLRITDIDEDGRFTESTKASVNHSMSSSYLIEHGDLVFARTGASVGKSYLYNPKDGQLVYAGFLIRVSPDPKRLVPTFLKYYVQSKTYWNWIKTNSMRSGQPGINGREYAALPIPLPPTLAEQEAIAEALSDADALIESLETLLAKKRQVKQGAMSELLTGKRRLVESGAWEVKLFGELVSIRKQKIDPRKNSQPLFCVELEHIEQGTGRLIGSSETSETSSIKSVFQKGDVLFGKLRAYLRKYWLADKDGVCSTEIWALIANPSLIIKEYLFQLVQMDGFIETASMAYGTHMPRTDWNVVKNYEFSVPDLPEQTAIAEILSDMDAEIRAVEEKLSKARRVKAGMMSALLGGRIRLIVS